MCYSVATAFAYSLLREMNETNRIIAALPSNAKCVPRLRREFLQKRRWATSEEKSSAFVFAKKGKAMDYIQWDQLIQFWAVQIQFWSCLGSMLALVVSYWTKKK